MKLMYDSVCHTVVLYVFQLLPNSISWEHTFPIP
jgi:hypothetical protein